MYVEDVGSVFYSYNEYEDGRECIAGDLQEIGDEEVARQFRQAEELLSGLLYTAESALGWGAMMVLAEATFLTAHDFMWLLFQGLIEEA